MVPHTTQHAHERTWIMITLTVLSLHSGSPTYVPCMHQSGMAMLKQQRGHAANLCDTDSRSAANTGDCNSSAGNPPACVPRGSWL